jgi:phage tail protein X
MANITSGSKYTVQEGDTLPSIAQKVYGNSNRWHEIYIANTQVLDNNPSVLSPGTKLYLPQIRELASDSLDLHTCTITAADGLNIRVASTVQSAIVAWYPPGTVLNYIEVVEGEFIHGNPFWGHSLQGHYFWMGGTDHPEGI